jgi:hypothetical protein
VLIGVEPNRIDLITSVDGLRFDAAWRRAVVGRYGGAPLRVLSVKDLIKNKRKVARPQDRLDVETLKPLTGAKR